MPQTFIVDQAATFQAVAFLGAEPRIEFGTRDKQETTKEARTHSGGLPKRFHNDACRKRALRASQRSTDPVAGRAGPGVPRAGGTQERAAGGPGLAAGPGAGLPGSGHPD
ncbi:hypothetical protein, partial [Micromonospora sp. KC721]|uniref:hypothetical protein n=1 Tax=Micromonospora sp. KC721 TaxID=2530380 RepID=UPI001A9F7071